jgi:hypothetical protein
LQLKFQDLLERSLHYVNKTINDEDSEKTDSEEMMKQQHNLVRELERVRSQLQLSQMVTFKSFLIINKEPSSVPLSKKSH